MYRKKNWKNKKVSPYRPLATHFFTRKSHDTFTVTYDGAATTSEEAWAFTLSALPNYTEFTTLFDQYKVKGIKAQFYPRTNVLALNNLSGTLTTIPPLLTCIDYDDNTAEDYNKLMEKAGTKSHSEFKPFSLFFRPKPLVEIYKTAISTGYAIAPGNAWLDCSNPDLPHYGLKVATLPYSLANTGNDPIWDIIFTYYVQFRQPR